LNELSKFKSEQVSLGELETLIGILQFCAQVIVCLSSALQHLIKKQTAWRSRASNKFFRAKLSGHQSFAIKWLHFYLEHWSGTLPLCRTIWSHPDVVIYSDIGTEETEHVVWGLGAWCQTSGEYISEPWTQSVFDESEVSTGSGANSVPFLETYGVLSAVLTLARSHQQVQVYCDNTTAAQICKKRFCKTSDTLNSYIAFYDIECTNRGLFVQVQQIPRTENRVSHTLGYGRHPEGVRLGVHRGGNLLQKIF
jgi:hypothetical protein